MDRGHQAHGRGDIIKESDMAEPVVSLLTSEGWFAMADLDGTDYYDVVAVKGTPKDFKLLMVELKIDQPKTVYSQAWKRLLLADFTAVAMPNIKSLTTVMRYDKQNHLGMILVTHGEAIWKVKVKQNPDPSKIRNRLAGTLFAYQKGYFSIPDNRPTATFTYWQTASMGGVSIEKLTEGWDNDIRELLGVKIKIEVETQTETKKHIQTSLFSQGQRGQNEYD